MRIPIAQEVGDMVAVASAGADRNGGLMEAAWQYQLRVYLTDDLAEVARRDPAAEALAPLTAVLRPHQASLVSQLDAFEAYVAAAEAEGVERFPLYKWTKATVQDPEKRGKHAKSFSVRVAGQEVYDQAAADALEADLKPLVGGGVVMRLSRHDTNPANNLQVPAAYR